MYNIKIVKVQNSSLKIQEQGRYVYFNVYKFQVKILTFYSIQNVSGEL